MGDNKFTIWELLIFITGCTVCAILLTNVLAIVILKIPSTPENKDIRAQLIDMLKYIEGAVMGIASAKIVGKKSE